MEVILQPLVRSVIAAGIRVHRALGPGLLESVYSECFCSELRARGIGHRTEVAVPLQYRDVVLDADAAYRVDVLVEDWLIIEIKAVEKLLPVHSAQVLTYLKLLNARQALLMNFCAPRLKDGLRSFILTR
jgi:GxxExxY protein